MSTTVTDRTPTAPGAASPPSSTDPTAGDLWRAAKGPVAVLLVVLLGGLVLALVAGDRSAAPLDPRSAGPTGARAVAELLRDQGVDVRLATTSAQMASTARRGDTLLVAQPDLLAGSQVESVRSIGADLVLVAPTEPDRYLVGVTVALAEPGVRAPGCGLPAARRAGAADSGGLVYGTEDAELADPALCYARDGEPSLVQGQVDSRPVTLLGSASPLTNSRLDDEGNAALAMGLLGAHQRLVWYLPSSADLPTSGQQSFYDLVPGGVWWGLVQLVVALLLLALWRGRRLGPVVVERLPVVVRAAETVEGRARLYRRSGARGRAADALRSGVRSRFGSALGLPRRADPAAVVAAVAARSRRDGAEVSALLYGAAPADDAALVRLADDLDALEREVRRP